MEVPALPVSGERPYTAVPIPPNFKGALVADPNNFFLTPFAPCDGCATRIP
jgi:hypothetical protein